ncbi:unnamed protein product [Protopolystoma xenopodis]|uniref:Uncharacterized protein n=1 Tax=Protopolystoma xenopodis TaxID=117903 RepID=A0A3S5BT38_9PLAT|nr:unnamed protein product [Protopolystoma xenopodis]
MWKLLAWPEPLAVFKAPLMDLFAINSTTLEALTKRILCLTKDKIHICRLPENEGSSPLGEDETDDQETTPCRPDAVKTGHVSSDERPKPSRNHVTASILLCDSKLSSLPVPQLDRSNSCPTTLNSKRAKDTWSFAKAVCPELRMLRSGRLSLETPEGPHNRKRCTIKSLDSHSREVKTEDLIAPFGLQCLSVLPSPVVDKEAPGEETTVQFAVGSSWTNHILVCTARLQESKCTGEDLVTAYRWVAIKEAPATGDKTYKVKGNHICSLKGSCLNHTGGKFSFFFH